MKAEVAVQTKARLVSFSQAQGSYASFVVERDCTASELCDALGLSKPVAKRVFLAGQLSCNHNVLARDSALRPGDELRLELTAASERSSQSQKPVEVLWHDRFALAANKPSGLLVHGDGAARDTLTARVQAWLVRQAQLEGWGQVPVPQALQRLDVETSGVVLFSLTREFQPVFDALVASHELRKCYIAVVRGRMGTGPVRICKPIARDRHDARRMRVGATGKASATRVMCLEQRRGTSLVACLLETGRRHQIRVHLASQGHPLVGDKLYGGPSSEVPLMLHACQESFVHPVTGEAVVLAAPWPDRFSSLYSPREINWSILEAAF